LKSECGAPEDVGVFVLGDLDGLVQGLSQIGEGGGGFGLELTLRDSGEDTAQGGAKIAGGKVISEKEGRYILSSLFRGLRLRFLLGVERAEMRVAGAARSAAVAAIGKVKAQRPERSFLGLCVTAERSFSRLAVKRTFSCVAVRRPTERFVDMEVSSELKDLSCKGSLAEGEAHYFTGGVMYQSAGLPHRLILHSLPWTLANAKLFRSPRSSAPNCC